jgi:glycerophosphoryl diester phosphodiesterase
MVTSWPTRPLAIAHRGGAGLAPENTMAAFEHSVALGLRHLETDLRATRDRRLALLHDASLHRVTGLRIGVRDCLWSDLGRIPVFGSHPVPSLPELLDAFPDVEVSVDLKDPRAIEPLAMLLRQRRYRDRVWVAGTRDAWIGQLRDLVPTARAALGWRSLGTLVAAARFGRRAPSRLPDAEFAHAPARLLRDGGTLARLVEMAATHEIGVIAWTVDDPTVIGRLLDAGVAGIISDRADVLREVLIARGEWIPMGRTRRRVADA